MLKTYAKELPMSSSETSHRQIYTQKPKDYVGSKKCLKCHLQYYKGWKTTLHSKMEQNVIPKGPDKTVKGDFSSDDPVLTFKLEDADIVVGSRFKQRYFRKIGDDWYMLPGQWNVATKKWVKYHPKNDWWAAERIYPEERDKRPTAKVCEG